MVLDIKRVLASKPRDYEPEELIPLVTPWGEALDPEQVLNKHPRPQFAREHIAILNGWWNYCIETSSDAAQIWKEAPLPEPDSFDGKILVPFSPEAALSGAGRQLGPRELLWYRRYFVIEDLHSDTQRYLLHFEAVDHACACYCNGVRVGVHEGAYLPFEFDITDALAFGNNELVLCVFDPSDTGTQLRGKQKLERSNIWYTAQSGIWQTVWLEVVPACFIETLELHPDADAGELSLLARMKGQVLQSQVFAVSVLDGGIEVASATALPDNDSVCNLTAVIPSVHLWSIEDPHLYELRITFGDDAVSSYCAFRTTTMETDARGVRRFCLNHKPLLLRGVLDQGYWPDGLLTAPSDDALVFDIQAMRDLGFNMLRKHNKVECDRWYYHCDRLGMLVWQDMVTGGGLLDAWQSSYKPTLFRVSWGRYRDDTPRHKEKLAAGDENYRAQWSDGCLGTVTYLRNHPSIVTWVLFNESWGQFDARAATERVRAADPTRPIDAVSGWYDQQCGDYLSVHNYFRDLKVYRDRAKSPRTFVISEFGGLTLPVEGHTSLTRTYGYEVFEDAELWQEKVCTQLAAVDALWEAGLAGYVYTQLSDVEEETNGLLTYDRRVNKFTTATTGDSAFE